MCTLTWGEVWVGVCRFVIPGVTQSIAIIMMFSIGSSLILVARSTKDIGKDAWSTLMEVYWVVLEL